MSSPSKIKGTRWETECADYLTRALGYTVERRTQKGNRDQGDLIVPAWTVECKAERALRLGDYLDELRIEQRNANTPYGVAIIKRRGHATAAHAYALLPMEVLIKLLPRKEDA